ncbi:MAG: hypothetical protein PHC48_10490 [Prevotella sp.]|nr:hypothetical protein [Prevotella sp.]MDD4534884.1 hypothetical protein [Prevotella sp.]
MKHLVLISALLLMSVASFGRKHVNETATVVADTIYFAADQTSVSNANQAAYYRLLLTQGTGVNKENVFTDYYMNGTLKAEGGYSFVDLSNDNNTVFNGKVTTYYVNGKEKLNGKYVNGKREGYFTLQLRDGGVAVVAYDNGKSKFDYFMVTYPNGKQEKRPISEISSLLQ